MPLDLPLPAAAQGHLRRLNTQRDLESVANLVELCFDDTLDAEGRTYLRNMRESARSAQWTGWVNSLAEYSPTPPSGLVWEENGQLVGNLSLIPIICRGQRCYLIANVAVHPDHRGRGIGRTLTATALDYIRSRNAPSAWLQVRHDNPPAIHIYQALGFQERTRRTTWFVSNQAPQVGIHRVARDPGHGDPALGIPGREGDVQDLGGDPGVIEEHFVKISHTKE